MTLYHTAVRAEALASQVSPIVRMGPIEDLENALVESYLDVAKATYRFLGLLREFDLRRGWLGFGCNDCAEWLDLKFKISRKTALEKVRVANTVWLFPKLDEAFASGVLSYSQVRAITRVVNPDNEAELVELGWIGPLRTWRATASACARAMSSTR